MNFLKAYRNGCYRFQNFEVNQKGRNSFKSGYCYRRYSPVGGAGSGAGKGGGDGGNIRKSGGVMGEREAAIENEYFYRKQKEQMEGIIKKLRKKNKSSEKGDPSEQRSENTDDK